MPDTANAIHAAVAIALAMLAQVLLSGAIGVTVPILARATGRDPAMAAPAVTAFSDLLGATLFFLIVLAVL